MLDKMLQLVVNAHSGQTDKAGIPYAFHCIAVMQMLDKDADEELKCIALGHDLFEDTDVTFTDIINDFGVRVANGILALTKIKGITYDDYIERICANEDAARVKLCDLRHNSDITRLKGVTDKDMARVAKYHRAYAKIKECYESE